MGPLPTRKTSRRKTATRRSHDAHELKHLVRCETCGEYKVAHRACHKCGTYNGRSVIDVSDDK
jgi:large subunit ribosomal protein L32